MTSKAFEGYSDADLEAELKRRKVRLAEACHPPMKGPFNWDRLLDLLDFQAKLTMKNGYEDDDFPHYVYENVMTTVYGADYFQWRNKQGW